MDSPVLDPMDGLGFLDLDFQEPTVHSKSMDVEFSDLLNLDTPSLGLQSNVRNSAGELDLPSTYAAVAVGVEAFSKQPQRAFDVYACACTCPDAVRHRRFGLLPGSSLSAWAFVVADRAELVRAALRSHQDISALPSVHDQASAVAG